MRAFKDHFGRAVLVCALFAGSLGLIPGPGLQAQPRPRDEWRWQRERYPRMVRALENLRDARQELTRAGHDFGGHRREASEAIDRAIRELEEALRHAPREGGRR